MLSDLIILLVAFIIIWVIASIPAYVAGKMVTGGRATFGEAMGATLGGVIVYASTTVIVGFFLGSVIGPGAIIWGVILGFIAFLAVYRSAFHTGWLGAFGIAVISVVVALIINLVVGALFGVSFPASLPHGISL
ncbi:MAG: hypothetical protein LYZ70_01160 [Nitrososphaerales archaeon]|nr:hypothetical protein [Nitrososphaerales archaeon]